MNDQTQAAATAPGEAAAAPPAEAPGSSPHGAHGGFWTMTLGSIGVVFGDIGTSPLYTMREALSHVATDRAITRYEIIGIVSLLIWAVLLIVTLKYIILLMRADNKGEGGMLSLLALVQRGMGGRHWILFVVGIGGAALFYADGIITPAISVLSAVEGLELVTPAFQPYILPITVGILFALFVVQSKGTGSVAAWFGPITALWFLVIAVLGLVHIGDDLGILAAFNPYYGMLFLFNHGIVGFVVLGAVFLAVTGAEALYADMGHFGKKPIRAAWLWFVMPALFLNYLGQGAFVLAHPEALAQIVVPPPLTGRSPLYLMAPSWALLPLVALATAATVIASQAVITGAFSITQQAIQLGLLPRMDIRYTSETTQGQIYVPQVNRLLFIGVIALVMAFGSSSRLASAYGIAVTGAMVLDTLLFFGFLMFVWRWRSILAVGLVLPLLIIEVAFFAANALKILEGGWVPLLIAAGLMVIMWTWVRGTRILADKTRRDTLPIGSVLRSLEKVQRVPGTAVFLTSEPEFAPHALMHNLKHNKVLHQTNVLLTVRFADTPRVAKEDRVHAEKISSDFWRVTVTYGYMDSPNVPLALSKVREQGLKFDIMSTSFFLGRRNLRADPRSGMPLWQDRLYIALTRGASDATEFFRIPSGRVVELGTQVLI